MPVHHLLATAATALLGALTAGRSWSLVAVLLGLAGMIIGGVALARPGASRRWTTFALSAGLVGAVIGGLIVAAADGGPGTGYGIVGGFIAIVIGLIATMLGALARARSRRRHPTADDRPTVG